MAGFALAQALPFADATFDTVVCQFGVMLFSDCIETNEFAHAVPDGVATIFPDDPPRFLPRTPHGYYQEALIAALLGAATEAAAMVVHERFGSADVDGLIRGFVIAARCC